MANVDERLVAVEVVLRRLDQSVLEMHTDVRSLLTSRAFTQGVWKTVTVVSGVISAVVALVIGFFDW